MKVDQELSFYMSYAKFLTKGRPTPFNLSSVGRAFDTDIAKSEV